MTTRCLFVFCLPEQIEEASARLPLVVIYWYRKEEHKPGALNCEKSPRKCTHTSFRIVCTHEVSSSRDFLDAFHLIGLKSFSVFKMFNTLNV